MGHSTTQMNINNVARDLPQLLLLSCRELIFHTNYLGSDQPSVTLNFSKGASNIIAQYYMVRSLSWRCLVTGGLPFDCLCEIGTC